MGKQYLDHFSNLCIGLTPLITRRENNRMIQLAQNAPIDRLLLETDAPYFVPSISEVLNTFKLHLCFFLCWF